MSPADAPLLLPPLLTHLAPPAGADPFVHAQAAAAEVGAGALIWGPDPALLRFAVVLEPDVPRAEAGRVHHAALAAVCDALAATCPPERAVQVSWPDAILFDGARLGGARFALSPGDASPPDWAVFGVELLRARPGLSEAGRFPDSTSLIEEGFEADETIVESFARHLMLYADHLAHGGFGVVAESLIGRIKDAGRDARIERDGDLTAPGRPRRPFPGALDGAGWRDAARGGPRL